MKIKVTYQQVQAAIEKGFVTPLSNDDKKIDAAKKLVKKLGVKGFRKVRLSGESYNIGVQCQWLTRCVAQELMTGLERLGYKVSMRETLISLNEKNLVDVITII